MPSRPRPNGNSDYLDRYTLVHAGAGAAAEASMIPRRYFYPAIVVFELVENAIKRRSPNLWPDATPDKWQNQLGDIAAAVVGYEGARAAADSKLGRDGVGTFVGFAAGLWIFSLYERRARLRGPQLTPGGP